MKIAILGYGRMGHMIEEIAQERGHQIVCRIDADNTDDFASPAFRSADVAIEFSQPDAAVDNILRCFTAGVPVVSGTTGWQSSMSSIKDMCDRGAGTLMWSSNFSIGVNIFMAVSRYMAKLQDKFPQYSCMVEEVHHVHKLDHPSGTAITIADAIVDEVGRLREWEEPQEGKTLKGDVLPVEHKRMGEVPGIHTVRWESDSDVITFSHSAKSRRGFALGAVMAAEWLKDKKGFHTVSDMLGF